MIIGGVAVIALGVPRLTVDIDATVAASAPNLERLVSILRQHAIVARMPDAEAFARARQVYLAKHEPSGIPIDISLAWLSFEEQALRASNVVDYAGIRIRVPRVEDLVVYKLIASRPQDIDDAEGLLTLHGSTMDIAHVRQAVAEFARVLEDEERPRTLERLLREVGIA